MSDPAWNRKLVGIDPESHIKPEPVGLDGIEVGLRVRSSDYGTGTVVAIAATGIQLYWDKPLLGTTDTHLLVHDRAFVASLERI